jgi:hypothetical protein
MSALFDFPSLLTVILLIICTATYLKVSYPTIYDASIVSSAEGEQTFGGPKVVPRNGLLGVAWKASRIGERLSPYIGVSCVIMAIHVLFIKQ